MIKLPIQVAPVQRNASPARYATSRGIKSSENLCSCHSSFLWCVVGWDRCPDGYHAKCAISSSNELGNCWCWCCRGEECLGPYA
jgi:hypothetical protein